MIATAPPHRADRDDPPQARGEIGDSSRAAM
jgi:hypothetical protein